MRGTSEFAPDFRRKELIIQLIKLYKKFNPNFYQMAVERCKSLRQTAFNDFGNIPEKTGAFRQTSEEFRLFTSLPYGLEEKINGFLQPDEARFLESPKETKWFLETFPEFKASEKY